MAVFGQLLSTRVVLHFRSPCQQLQPHTYLSIVNAPGLDHTVLPHLHRLCLANPSLGIGNLVDAPLKGSRFNLEGSNKGCFYCCCVTCSAATLASPQLTRLMSALSAAKPSITAITREDWPMELSMPGGRRSPQLTASSLKLLNLMGYVLL